MAVVTRAGQLHRVRIPWLMGACAIIAAVSAAAAAYLVLPILLEDAETDIASVSALVMRGLPLYPDLNAAPRYILLYGPITYLAHIPFFFALQSTLFSFKLLGVLCFFVSLVGLYAICRRYADPKSTWIGVGCASLVFFRYLGIEFWGRIDPLILALTVLTVWITLRGPGWLAVVWASIAFSTIPNLKISGAVYLLPLIGLLVLVRGWRAASFAVALAAILFPLPFLLPNVSWTNYRLILQAAATHGIVTEFLIRNLQYSLLFLLPIFVALRARKQWDHPRLPELIYAALIGLGLLVTSFFGAKSGAGSYHLIPYVAPTLHLYFWLRRDSSAAIDQPARVWAPAWVLTTLLLSNTHVQAVLHEVRNAHLARQAMGEVEAANKTWRAQTYELGVGASFADLRTRYGFIPTFSGQPYTIAGAAIRDLQFGGVAIPPATIQYLNSCRTNAWLIPKGEQPFSALNTYFEAPHSAFDDDFRRSFETHYHKTSSGELYDTWTCK